MKFLFSFLFSVSYLVSTAQVIIHIPEATVYDANGVRILTTSISNANGPTVVITYATSWSPGSVDLLDDLNGLYKQEYPKSDVKIVAVNCENTRNTNEVMAEAAKHKWNSFEVLHDADHTFMDAMKTRSAPMVFFLDANKTVIYCVQSCTLTADKIYAIAASIKNKKITADTVYFDSDWFPCEKTGAKYYRKLVKDSSGKYLVTDYFMNGQMQMRVMCTQVYPHYRVGILTYYYESGQKKQEGYYSNNKKSGLWYNWFEAGKFQSKINYLDDKRCGHSQEFYPGGALESEGGYYDGIQNGNWINYYENGTKKRQTQWNKGMRVWCKGWYENGALKFNITSFENNFPKISETFYDNGQRVNQFVYDLDSNVTEIKQFYANGMLKSSSKFLVNKIIGYTEYYSDGTQKMIFSVYDMTSLTGSFQSWYENGKKECEMNFSNGQAINKATAWFDNGQIKEKINFATNDQKSYSVDGKVQKKNSESKLANYNSPNGQYTLMTLTVNYYLSFIDEDLH